MATTYTASLRVVCWKQHNCVSCGALFRYLFDQTITGSAGTQDAAQGNLRANIQKILDDGVETHPCPQCGLIQPDMLADKRKRSNTGMMILMLCAVVVVLGIGLSEVVGFNVTAWLLFLVGLVMAGIFFFQSQKNPNENLNANRQAAAQGVQAGKLAVDQPGNRLPTGVQPGGAKPSMAVYGIMAASVLLLPTAEALRLVSGWAYNADCSPGVVGPGDTVKINLPDKIESIKGYWKADAEAELTDADKFGLSSSRLTAVSSTNSWGNNISVKSSEKNKSSNVWIKVTMPNEKKLAGETVNLHLTLDCVFPHLQGTNTFDEGETKIDTTRELHLASSNAGALYFTTTWIGFLGGILGLFLSGFLFRRHAASGVQRTQVQVLAAE